MTDSWALPAVELGRKLSAVARCLIRTRGTWKRRKGHYVTQSSCGSSCIEIVWLLMKKCLLEMKDSTLERRLTTDFTTWHKETWITSRWDVIKDCDQNSTLRGKGKQFESRLTMFFSFSDCMSPLLWKEQVTYSVFVFIFFRSLLLSKANWLLALYKPQSHESGIHLFIELPREEGKWECFPKCQTLPRGVAHLQNETHSRQTVVSLYAVSKGISIFILPCEASSAKGVETVDIKVR